MFIIHNYFSCTISATEIRELCEDNTCPTDNTDVTADNCCVNHANIHVCAPSVSQLSGLLRTTHVSSSSLIHVGGILWSMGSTG